MKDGKRLGIKIFADGADIDGILRLADDTRIAGFTTNPTLMRKSGISDYEGFARKILDHITEKPVSFEVIADDFDEMRRQARLIASWGSNVHVKVPVTNTKGEGCAKVIGDLSADGVRLNITAVMTERQTETIAESLSADAAAIVSVFAGRVADTGRDPVPLMQRCLSVIRPFPAIELLWASPREVLNLYQADEIGCHIITMTHDLLQKLDLCQRDLDVYSLDTVKMFHEDARHAGFLL